MPSARRTVPVVVAFALLVVPAIAAAQGAPGVNSPDLSPGVRFGAGFVFSLVGSLGIGAMARDWRS